MAKNPEKPGMPDGWKQMLTDTQCRNAPPKPKPYKLTDEKGLYLEVKPNRAKVWRYRFELVTDGTRKEGVFTIGEYTPPPKNETEQQATERKAGGQFTLTEAREERNKARAQVKQGVSPVQNRQTEKILRAAEKATTFQAVAAEWISMKDWEKETIARRVNMLERVVFPRIGALPVKDVTSALVLDVLKAAAKQNGPSVKDDAQRTMSGIFDLAVATARTETNPVYAVRRALPANKTQHKRALTAEEIGVLMRDFTGYDRNVQTVAALRLMWLTLCRPSEVVEAQWQEFDLKKMEWRIPAERMKKRKAHAVPLPSQAVELLRRMHAITGSRAHVFPHRDDREKPMTTATLRTALNAMGWGTKYSPHATRTTGSTRLHEMGFSSEWIERQIAHADQNRVRGTYNHADHMRNRAGMMQQWADLLDAWERGASIEPIKAGRALKIA